MMSLLSLRADTVGSPSAAAALQEAKGRLRSMETLHDSLYRAANPGEMSIGNYLPSLVDEIMEQFPDRRSVQVEAKIDDFVLGAQSLSTLGIIVNELITNTMKHAFGGRGEGTITIAASMKDRRAEIVIGDDGVGIPETIDLGNPSGFGLQLTGMLADQLGGTMRIERNRATTFALEFESRG
jgi:two-component sensor histidine kinase